MSLSDLHVVVGLGVTGLSCVKYLKQQGFNVAVTDTRLTPPHLKELIHLYPDVPVALGKLSLPFLSAASALILSPGIALKSPLIAEQVQRGIPVMGDIELFARATQKPILAITGTNAKSTVTTLVGEMVKAAGFQVETGGNLGIPALDLLTPSAEVFVLELSSFQLETTHSLKAKVATILNITPDHMDRYDHLSDYQAAKQRIYQHCETAVWNLDDPLTAYHHANKTWQFTLKTPLENTFGLLKREQEIYLAFEDQPLLSIRELKVAGQHYQANALASLAIGHGFGLPFAPMLSVLKTFKGLPHRCQFVRELNGVKWYNDSKGTNVGASLAAILGLGKETQGKLILIAGGIGKNADFTPLTSPVKAYARHVVLIGEAAEELKQVLTDIPVSHATTMAEAISLARTFAQPGDDVLLSPACASFDMFKDYAHRGEVFTALVSELQ